MKRLLLVRHAKSDWSDEGLRDFDRPLNGRGEHDAPLMAAFLRERELSPTLLVSSPANRAYSTARLFAPSFGIAENDISTDARLYEASVATILGVAAALPNQYDCVAVFSHNPGLTGAVSVFTDDYVANVPTCGVGVVELDAADWAELDAGTASLRDLFAPKRVLAAYA